MEWELPLSNIQIVLIGAELPDSEQEFLMGLLLLLLLLLTVLRDKYSKRTGLTWNELSGSSCEKPKMIPSS